MTTIKELSYQGVNIPYYETVIKINGKEFQKYFIFDIRNWSTDFITKIFENFNKFQDCLLSNEFFFNINHKIYPINLMLNFLIDEDRTYEIKKGTIKNDFQYALKNFINYEQFLQITEAQDLDILQRISVYKYSNKQVTIQNFNLIFGRNGSGKTTLLNWIAEKESLPVLNLWGDFKNGKILTNTSEYRENLTDFINYCHKQGLSILLDDFGWNAFDDRNRIEIIDQLYAYSLENNVIFTSSQESIKRLVKARSYLPNIIELS